MGSFSIWHWVIVLAIILLLFGRGKIPALMGDMAKGIKAFKAGMKEDPKVSPKQIDETAETAGSVEAATETVEAAEATETVVNKEKAAEG
jgi:sec-independent protein translocase protein TatA